MDPLSPLTGAAITTLGSTATFVPPFTEESWAHELVYGTAYGVLIGYTALSGAPIPPFPPVGDISIWVRDAAAGWINRADWCIYPLKRTVSIGSRSQLTLTITNAGKAQTLDTWRFTVQFDNVVVYIGTYRFFTGQYISGVEERYKGTQYFKITATCLSFDFRMDMIMFRQQLVLNPGDSMGIGLWLHNNVLLVMNGYFGLGFTSNIGAFDALPQFTHTETWDTVSLLSACRGICDEFNLEMTLDQNLNLWFFNTDSGVANGLPQGIGFAPFSIVDLTPDAPGDPVWQNLVVTDGGTQYTNRAYVKTDQILKGNASDPNPFTLSYVPSAENAGEIARVGPMEVVQSVKNQSLGVLPDIAGSSVLDFEIHQITLETYEIGFEPGQLLIVDTTLPLLDDTLLVESVDSDLVGPFLDGTPFIADSGPLRFAHSIKASNAKMHRRTAGWRVWQGITDGIAPPVDRITYTPSWTIAEDLSGIANPGVLVGPHGAPIPAIRDGICRQVSLSFTDPPLTTDVIMDILQNGTTIFPGSGMTFPVGTTDAVVTFTFANDPQPVHGPTSATANDADQFTLMVIQGDADAKNGLIALTIQG